VLGILSASVSITRYKVEGTLKTPVMETVLAGLQNNTITEIDEEVLEKSAGWTSTHQPFFPDFEGSSFMVGPYFIFSLRIDTKRVPSKTIQKYVAIETRKKLVESGREYLAREEKRMIKDNVTNMLYRRVPAVPGIYDLVWNHEAGSVWFFSNLKSANETVETLFLKSFNLTLIRMFPYTSAFYDADLSESQRDALSAATPTSFMV
jgi:DNA recombination-dependent growth factor C